MIPDAVKSIIIEFAKEYNVSSVYLFGSALEDYDKAHDIDIGVEGLKPGMFFKFWSKLDRKLYKELKLDKEIDLVDFSDDNPFTRVAKKRSIKIYG